MHRRAAELAHRAGAPAPEVARQLLAARDTAQDWALPVLRAAAEQLLADGAAERAAACLELAHEAAPDEDQRAALRLRLSAIARRTAPGAAERHLAEPLAAARAGRLPPPRMGPLARLLMAHGRIDEAGEVLDRLSAVSGAPAATPSAALDEAVCTLDPLDGLSAFPGWSARGPARQPRPAGHPGAIRHPAAFWALPDSADSGSAAAAADRFLRGASLSDGTLEPILQAVRVLLHLGGPQRAVPWCETYADEAVRRTAPGWQAAFSGLHAEALLRQGDLTGAEATAAAALDAAAMPERGASVLLTGIAGTLIRARTAMGHSRAPPPNSAARCPSSSPPACTAWAICAPGASTTWPPAASTPPSATSWTSAA